MKKYILSKKSYDLLRNIDLSEMGNSIRFNNDNCFFETDNVRLLEIILTEEIAVKGMKKVKKNATNMVEQYMICMMKYIISKHS